MLLVWFFLVFVFCGLGSILAFDNLLFDCCIGLRPIGVLFGCVWDDWLLCFYLRDFDLVGFTYFGCCSAWDA